MTSTSNGNGTGQDLGLPSDNQFLYTVLNLPTGATDHEVRERYKQLSILFHPDKQQNELTKATAVRRFLEVQKAYEVLSDPVSRKAYDLYGLEGLKLLQGADYEVLSMDELSEILKRSKLEADRAGYSKLLRSRGFSTLNFDLSSFFDGREDRTGNLWSSRVLEQWSEIPYPKGSVRQTLQKDITPSTTLKLSARAFTTRSSRGTAAGSDFVGTVRHQFSPRIAFEGHTSLLFNRPLRIKAIYEDESNSLVVQSHFSPAYLRAIYHAVQNVSSVTHYLLLPLSVTYSRRLFPRSNARGTFAIAPSSASALPLLSFSISSAYPFDLTQEADVSSSSSSASRLRPPSRSGLARGAYYYSIGFNVDGVWPGLSAEYGVTFAELGVQLKAVAQTGFRGFSSILAFVYSKDDKGADAEVTLSPMGVQFKLGFVYLNHRLELPIILSHENDFDLALWATVVPTTALTLAYHFVLKPLERKRRMEFFRRARRELRDAQSDLARQTEETTYLLQDVAKRRMQAEAATDGLVIVEASYGAAEHDTETEGLQIDVTIPLQALVNKSQLYIPGKRSKAGLQGFRDPAPNVAKSLRVRYTFRGREHYAEIPDFKPTVLPLEDHLVS